jgi:putative Holliday junction resolvase
VSETVLGFDFGEKRIGVAVGNTITSRAEPLTTIHAESNEDRMAAVAYLVKEWQPARLVIGEPAHENGSPHEIARLAHKFGNRLHEKFRLPVEYVNEFLSSTEASRHLTERGITGREQKAHLDAVAAQVILQSWFDNPHEKNTPHAA